MSNAIFDAHIFEMIPAALGGLPDHMAVDCIQRLIPEGFPIHLAIHRVSVGEDRNDVIYSAPHTHQEWDEVNVLVSSSSLTFAITLGEEVREIAAPATIWIPSGVEHAANAVSGEGFFLCIRIDRKPAEQPTGKLSAT